MAATVPRGAPAHEASRMVLWLVLMVRALKPAFKRNGEDRSLLSLFLISSIAIPMFYAAGLMYGQRSHLVTVANLSTAAKSVVVNPRSRVGVRPSTATKSAPTAWRGTPTLRKRGRRWSVTRSTLRLGVGSGV